MPPFFDPSHGNLPASDCSGPTQGCLPARFLVVALSHHQLPLRAVVVILSDSGAAGQDIRIGVVSPSPVLDLKVKGLELLNPAGDLSGW
ncbi:UNVERIFIED_CONTAM: hypothetical protein FKN15_073524 [Acipenser sinensis]